MTNTVNDLFKNFPALLLNFLIALGAILLGLLIKVLLSRIFSYYARISDSFLIKTIIRRMHNGMYFFVQLLLVSDTRESCMEIRTLVSAKNSTDV